MKTSFSGKSTINIGGTLIDLSSPKVMGVLNITPDSFFDGGKYQTEQALLSQVEKMLAEGADFIDIGAYSSRPHAEHISEEEELNRLKPALQAVVKNFPQAVISVDTFRHEVARQAIAEGAHLINDISAGELDEKMFDTIAELQVPYVMMHMKGTPQTMQQQATYENLLTEVMDYFIEKIERLRLLGVNDIIIDPGFGFAKTLEQNYELLSQLDKLKMLQMPVLAGVSRKSMIYKPLNCTPEEALNGTTVANTIALLKGANILRVHDVKEAVQAITLVSKLQRA